MEVIWKSTTSRECSERFKENTKGIRDTKTQTYAVQHISMKLAKMTFMEALKLENFVLICVPKI